MNKDLKRGFSAAASFIPLILGTGIVVSLARNNVDKIYNSPTDVSGAEKTILRDKCLEYK